jgi:hypothetical protein
MTAEEIVSALDARPVVMGPWVDGMRREHIGGRHMRVWWSGAAWLARLDDPRAIPRIETRSTDGEASARALADEMATARGWKLMGGGE